MKKFLLFSILIITVVISCQPDEPDNIIQDLCDQEAVIDTEIFKYDESEVTITKIELIQDCLHIEYSGRGCDGTTWKVSLIDSEFIEETSPTRREILLQLIDKEECEAIITKTTTFDLSPLRITGKNEIIFSLKGWDEDITYLY